MLTLVSARGPDDSRVEPITPQLLFGSTRLAIVDATDAGRMPMRATTGGQHGAIVYNGEIYNHQELRGELVALGHHFRSRSDTEVVLRAYLQWGEKCVERFNGMFAFALWDDRRQQLFLARDRFGIKPLFVYEDRNHLVVSSDVRPLLLTPGLERDYDHEALTSYMILRFAPGTKTLFRGIERLAPATYQIVQPSPFRIRSHRYWRPTFRPSQRSEAQLREELQERLGEAVGLSSRGPVEPAVLLSGGLDSSAVVALLAQLGQRSPSTFACRFAGARSVAAEGAFGLVESVGDETPYADLVSARYACRHRTIEISPWQDQSLLDDLVFAMGEPIASTDAPGHFAFARQLPSRPKVVLSGTGSDEIFGGYAPMYFGGLSPQRLRTLGPEDYLRLFTSFSERGALPVHLLGEQYRRPEYCLALAEQALRPFPKAAYPDEAVNELAFFELAFGLPGWELDQADRLYMAASIELRPPFLENRLVDFALTIPSALKVKAGEEKYLLKAALEPLLPRPVVRRRKFPSLGTPRDWYLRPWFRRHLDTLQARPLPFFDREGIARLVRAPHQCRDYDTLYRIVLLHVWHDLFFGRDRRI
jgi:asparagine synthase (glutamine-hydrolysing)